MPTLAVTGAPPVTTSASLATSVTMPTEGSAASACLEAGKVEAPKIMRKRAAQAICQTPRARLGNPGLWLPAW